VKVRREGEFWWKKGKGIQRNFRGKTRQDTRNLPTPELHLHIISDFLFRKYGFTLSSQNSSEETKEIWNGFLGLSWIHWRCSRNPRSPPFPHFPISPIFLQKPPSNLPIYRNRLFLDLFHLSLHYQSEKLLWVTKLSKFPPLHPLFPPDFSHKKIIIPYWKSQGEQG